MMINPIQIQSQINYASRQGWIPYFQQAAKRYSMDIAVLLAVGSRETGLGTDSYYQSNNFTGRDGHGKGIMQIDDRYHAFARMVRPDDHEEMINYGAQFLNDLRNQFDGNMKAALAAYNTGPSDVRYALSKGLNPDLWTTKQNYSKDVLERAKMIRRVLGINFLGKAKIVLPVMFMAAGGGIIYYQISTNR